MARLIDAEDLKETLSNLVCKSNNADFLGRMNFVLREIIPQVIDAQPTIDAQSVRHGRWIDGISRGSYSIYCSCCGSHKETICPSEYCPACGARMDGGEQDV